MDDLKTQREKYTTKVFWLGLQIIFIFAIPAFLGAFIGLKLDAIYQTGRKITLSILIFTFILSWAMVAREYIKLNKGLKKINQDIKEENK